MQIMEPSAELVWSTPDALGVIEAAGRVCYRSEDKIADGTAEKFVRMIIARGHESVLEHASASFRIITDRGITHEIVRHRIASFSQESTRYCNYGAEKFGREITVIRPPDLTPEQEQAWRDSCEAAECAYFRMLDTGASPQMARAVLPTCLKTEIVMTANFREWRHFLRLRLSSAAHPQIIQIATMIKDALLRECGAVFGEA